MKILHVISSISPARGGPSRAIVDMEYALAGRGLDVTTVTIRDPEFPPPWPIGATRHYFRRDTGFYRVSLELWRWLDRNIAAFDLVHVHGLFSFAPVAAARAARRYNIPYVVRPFGVLMRYGMTKRRPWLKRLSFSLIERDLARAASALHFTSQIEKAETAVLGLGGNGVVIPLGVGVGPKPVRAGSSEGLFFLFLSRLDPKKNLEGLLQGFALANLGGARLRIAGEGEPAYVAGLKTLAQDIGISDRVEWLGHLGGHAKQEALAQADAFVLPSFSENFGIAAVEALAAGLPCLVSAAVPVQYDIVQAQAGMAISSDPAGIAAGLGAFAQTRVSHAVMSQAAYELASRVFSREQMGARLEALYRTLLAGKSAA